MDIETFRVTIERKSESFRTISVDFRRSPETPKVAKEESNQEKAFKALSKLSEDWVSTAISFLEVVPILSEVGYFYADHGYEKHTITQVKDLAISHEVIQADDIEREVFHLPRDAAPSLIRTLSRVRQIAKTANTLNRNALSSLVSEYETLIAQLLLAISQLQQEALLSGDTQIPISELAEHESFDSLRAAVVSRKIEEILHSKSHYEVLTYIAERFGVNLTSDTVLMREFVEICQRRHIIVHSGGLVSQRYIKNCCAAGWSESELGRPGEPVDFNRNYLRRATARVFMVGFFSLHILWQKLLPNEAEGSYSRILEASHDFLENDLTKMARRCCEFLLSSKGKSLNARLRSYFVINLAQSYWFDKNLDDEQRANGRDEALSKHDWSIQSPTTSLALACLREDWTNISSLVKAAVSDDLSYENVLSWNVFRNAWHQSSFAEAVCEAFGVSREKIRNPNLSRGLKDMLVVSDLDEKAPE